MVVLVSGLPVRTIGGVEAARTIDSLEEVAGSEAVSPLGSEFGAVVADKGEEAAAALSRVGLSQLW